jgi:hypothetical protein
MYLDLQLRKSKDDARKWLESALPATLPVTIDLTIDVATLNPVTIDLMVGGTLGTKAIEPNFIDLVGDTTQAATPVSNGTSRSHSCHTPSHCLSYQMQITMTTLTLISVNTLSLYPSSMKWELSQGSAESNNQRPHLILPTVKQHPQCHQRMPGGASTTRLIVKHY